MTAEDRVAAAIESVSELDGAHSVERLGGLTNANFKVEVENDFVGAIAIYKQLLAENPAHREAASKMSYAYWRWLNASGGKSREEILHIANAARQDCPNAEVLRELL